MLEEILDNNTEPLLNKYFNNKTNTLILPFNFNEKVDNLPQSLTQLILPSTFNQKVDNLPQSLTHLTFGVYFNQKVDNLPHNLTHLTFGSYIDKKINKLPKNLTSLILNFYLKNINLKKLPKNLKEFSLACDNNFINNIPKHIEKIYIWFSDDENINKKVVNLPSTLKEIIILYKKYEKYINKPFGTILTILYKN
jgi:hypothetical protein